MMDDRLVKAALARELLEAHPHAAKRGLARRLAKEHPELFATVDQARQVIRYAAGALGDENRKYVGIKKSDANLGNAGWKPAIPPSLAEPWEPLQIDGPATVLVLSDLHVPYHSIEACKAAIAHARKKIKPTVLLLNGDIIDFYTLSRYQKNPKKRDLGAELEMTEATLELLADTFPKARRIYKAGNHDERWDHYLWNHAEALFGLENMRLQDMLHLSDYDYEFVGDQRPVMAGKLAIFHGHELGRGIMSPVNPARGAFMRTLSSVLVGHHHRTSTHAESDIWHSEIVTWSSGCLCDMRPEYSRVNKWNWGFSAVNVEADGEYNVHNLRISEDWKVRAA